LCKLATETTRVRIGPVPKICTFALLKGRRYTVDKLVDLDEGVVTKTEIEPN